MTVVGCSPAWPNPGQAQSCLLVEGAAPGGPGRLLVDCGPGSLAALRALEGGGWPRIDAILLTHLHIDHWADVLGWLWGSVTGAGKGLPAPQLWVPAAQRERFLALARDLGDFGLLQERLGVHGYPEEEPFAVAGFDALAMQVAHYGMPTCGIRLEHGGAAMAVSADTGPTPALARLARGAGLFVCEATLADGQDEGALRGHLSAAEALEAHREAGARRLLLTHRPAELPAPAGAEVAVPGLVVEL